MTDPLTPEAIAQQLNEEADSPFTPSPRRKLLKDASLALSALAAERDDQGNWEVVAKEVTRGMKVQSERLSLAEKYTDRLRSSLAVAEALFQEAAAEATRANERLAVAAAENAALVQARDRARQFVVELALVLFEHYPQIECDEKRKRDVAQCGYDDWRSEPQKSVGAALQEWWKHVATLADPTYDPFADVHSIIGATPEPTTPEEEAQE